MPKFHACHIVFLSCSAENTSLSAARSIGRAFLFVAVGIVTITVGFFMLRGTMNMWNRAKKPDDEKS